MGALLGPDARAVWAAPAGTVLMVGAAMSWAIGTVLTKARRWNIATTVLTGWQLVLGGVPIVLGALARLGAAGGTGPVSQLTSLSAGAVLGTAYATFVGVIFCHWAWFRLVAILPPAVAAIGTLGIPVVGLLASALVLGEPVGSAEIAALILVVSGLAILIGGLRGGRRESPPGRAAVSTPGREWR
jgi:drug/metabolite transporter (DMT)-like permease